MKRMYHLGDDLFIAIAFCSFIIGGVLRMLGLDIGGIFKGIITPESLMNLSVMSLLFSMALSLYDIAHGQK